MRTMFERLGGDDAIAAVVDGLYERLTTDRRVLHHFAPSEVDRIKAGQRRWFRAVLGGADLDERPDLAAAHRGIDITDEQVDVVIGHLESAMIDAGVGEELRRQVAALVTRLWYARRF